MNETNEKVQRLAAEKYPDVSDYTGLVRAAVKGDRRAFVAGYLTRDAEPNVQVEAVLRMCDALEQSIAKGNVAKESEHVLYWGVQDVRRAIEEAGA